MFNFSIFSILSELESVACFESVTTPTGCLLQFSVDLVNHELVSSQS